MTRPFKALIVGASGSGKTSLARTATNAFVVAAEEGFSSLSGVDETGAPIFDGKIVQATDLLELEDLCTWIAGKPYAIASPNEPYGEARYTAVCQKYGGTFAEKHGQPVIIIDSLTDISRRLMQRAERAPETISKAGVRDGFAVHGKAKKDAEWLIGILVDLYDGKIVVLAVGDVIPSAVDGEVYVIKSDTKKASGSIAEKVEATLFLGVSEYDRPLEDGTTERVSFRYIRTEPPAPGKPGYGLPLKDRSGTLKSIEAPNLDELIKKVESGKRLRALQTELPDFLQ